MDSNKLEEIQNWTKIAQNVLLNKKIVQVRYFNDSEMKAFGWTKRPILFVLEDGLECFISQDDEGNNGGSLFVGEQDIIPALDI
jgi:hypothetical protein